MTQPIQDWTLAELLERTASAEPTPSAGAVAAVSASLAMGLVAMGFEIAAKRKRSGRTSFSEMAVEELSALAQQSRDIARALLRQGEDDQAAVRQYLRTSRSSEVEAREALIHATEVPLAAARTVRDGLALAETAARVAPPPVRADVAAGALLLQAALRGLLGGVQANLRLLPRDTQQEALAQEALELASSERAPLGRAPNLPPAAP